MYLDFFGLKEHPFSIAPDPRYLYMSERHREALAHLLYGVTGQGGFIVLTGEVGTGKTTICRCFLNQVPKNTDVAYIVNPKLSARELMATICDELSIVYPESASIKVLSDFINRYLLQAHAENRHTVLIIDEAQNLRVDVLEQLRLLTNLETSEKKLLQIILLGQPELREILAQNELRQLAQRVTARYHLNELNRIEVGAYIKCRLAVAGRRGRLFNPDAVKKIYKLSDGVPRLINLIADRALLGAYAMQSDFVEAKHIQKAYREIQGERIKKPLFSSLKLRHFYPTLFALLLMALGSYWLNSQHVENIFTKNHEYNNTKNTTPMDPPLAFKKIDSNNIPINTMTSELSSNIKDDATKKISNGITDNFKESYSVEIDSSLSGEKNLNKVGTVKEDIIHRSAPFLDQITGLKAHEDDKFKAYQSLFNRWGLDYKDEPFMLACDFAEQYGLRCLHKNGNWRSLLKLDRPAVLTLVNEVGERLYFSLLAIDAKQALINYQDKQYWVSLDEIDRYWLGEYSIVWKLPPYKSRVIKPGQMLEDEWLKTNLSKLNIPHRQYDTLDKMIKDFQLSAGLVPDGVVGSMTLIQMNSRLGFDCPKLMGEI